MFFDCIHEGREVDVKPGERRAGKAFERLVHRFGDPAGIANRCDVFRAGREGEFAEDRTFQSVVAIDAHEIGVHVA